MHVRIVGRDDIERDKLEKLAREVAAEMRVTVHVEREGAAALPDGRPLAVPALLLDGELKVSGRMPLRNELASWLQPRWARA